MGIVASSSSSCWSWPTRRGNGTEVMAAAEKKERDFLSRAVLEAGKESSRRRRSVTVMQWNVLAYGLSAENVRCPGGNQGGFDCQPGALEWEGRREGILQEMIRRRPHLMGCQEVDDFDYFLERLSPAGYDGLFQPKPASPCYLHAFNIGPDGCAVFFLRDRFRVSRHGHRVLLGEGGARSNSVALWASLVDLTSPSAAVASDAEDGKVVFVVTHLKAKESERSRLIRHEQAKDLAKMLSKLSASEGAGVICCGDFNGTPEEPFYGVMSEQLRRPDLRSAYRAVLPGREEPTWTTWKRRVGTGDMGIGEKKRCIDYVWYSKDHFRPTAILDLPKEEDVHEKRLPSLDFPSDHLNLWVDFSLVKDEAEEEQS